MKQNHGYEINYIENTIIVNKSFLKKAGTIGSKEYNELAKVRRDFPDFRIQQREDHQEAGQEDLRQADLQGHGRVHRGAGGRERGRGPG